MRLDPCGHHNWAIPEVLAESKPICFVCPAPHLPQAQPSRPAAARPAPICSSAGMQPHWVMHVLTLGSQTER